MAQLVKRRRDRPSSIPRSYGKLEVSVLLAFNGENTIIQITKMTSHSAET